MDRPVHPWEEELAAEAMRELQPQQELDDAEARALKLAEAKALIAAAELAQRDNSYQSARWGRFAQGAEFGPENQGSGLALFIHGLSVPWCLISVMVVLIVLAIGLHLFARAVQSLLQEHSNLEQFSEDSL